MKLIAPFLKIQDQLRIFHWFTSSYAQHKAFGKAYEELNDLIDSFVEILIGKHGASKTKFTFKYEIHNYDENYALFLNDCIAFLQNLSQELESSDTDLLNIRDEMLATINRLKYLLSLN